VKKWESRSMPRPQQWFLPIWRLDSAGMIEAGNPMAAEAGRP
jgi:hypothetical protein